MKKTSANFITLPIEKLKTDDGPFIPLDDSEFKELKESIQKYGLVYPLVVTRDYQEKDKYLVLDGRNRYRVLLSLGQKEIPCFFVDVDFPQAYIISYETELFRRHLSDRERTDAIKRRSNLEKELIIEYKRRILDNLQSAGEEVKEVVSSIKDLSVLIELYYTSENFANLSSSLQKRILASIFQKAPDKNIEVQKQKQENDQRLREEKEKYQLKVKELEKKIKELEKERKTVEQNFKKIADELKKKIEQEMIKKFMKSDEKSEVLLKEYKKQVQEKLAQEQAITQSKIKDLTSMINNLQKQLEEAKEERKKLEKEQKRILNERENLKLLITELKNDFRSSTIEPLFTEIHAFKSNIKSITTRLKLIAQHQSAIPQEDFLQLDVQLKEVKEEYKKLNKVISSLKFS